MTEYIATHLTEMKNMLEDVLKQSSDMPSRAQQITVGKIFMMAADIASELEQEFYQKSVDESDLVTDLEHIISVGVDKVDQSQLPSHLRNLSQDEYIQKLKETLENRRDVKDWCAVYKVVKERCTNISNFINKMDTRQYEPKYKRPKPTNLVGSAQSTQLGYNTMVPQTLAKQVESAISHNPFIKSNGHPSSSVSNLQSK